MAMISELFAELKRRRVFRVAGIYVVSAFAALQGVQLLVDALTLSHSVMTILTLVALFAFPIVVALAWVFDVTPDGVRRTTSSSSNRSVAYVGIGIIIALV